MVVKNKMRFKKKTTPKITQFNLGLKHSLLKYFAFSPSQFKIHPQIVILGFNLSKCFSVEGCSSRYILIGVGFENLFDAEI